MFRAAAPEAGKAQFESTSARLSVIATIRQIPGAQRSTGRIDA
jgi:hypothetical protein